jgi:hypothetical protein
MLSFNDTFYISSDIFTVEHIQILEQKMEENNNMGLLRIRKAVDEELSDVCIWLQSCSLFII